MGSPQARCYCLFPRELVAFFYTSVTRRLESSCHDYTGSTAIEQMPGHEGFSRPVDTSRAAASFQNHASEPHNLSAGTPPGRNCQNCSKRLVSCCRGLKAALRHLRGGSPRVRLHAPPHRHPPHKPRTCPAGCSAALHAWSHWHRPQKPRTSLQTGCGAPLFA